MSFPFGKAPLALLVTAIISGAFVYGLRTLRDAEEIPDLVVAVFAETHKKAYDRIIGRFEEEHGVDVEIQLVQFRALQNRLQSAMMAGLDEPQPDLVEVERTSFGYFTKGPIEDVGFVDLTDKLRESGLDEKMVQSRLKLWSNRGRQLGIPHDVHPVGLAYRKDITDSLGIDVSQIKTWDDFVKMGRRITQDLNGDGIPDRYAMEGGNNVGFITTLMLQKGVRMFNEDGILTMNCPETIDVMLWYVRQNEGPNRIAFPTGDGQRFAQAMADGLVVFYVSPDWRTASYQKDVPSVAGKMAFMPLPAWTPGGPRTSTMGGTCISITKAARNKGRFELAWKCAEFLYTNEEALPDLFRSFNILPPYKEIWDHPAFSEPNLFFGGQNLGGILIELAEETPVDYISPYTEAANNAIGSAYVNILNYYKRSGEDGLRQFAETELARQANIVLRDIEHNRFIGPDAHD